MDNETESTYYSQDSVNRKHYLYNYTLYEQAGRQNGLRYCYDTWSTLLCNMSYNTGSLPEEWLYANYDVPGNDTKDSFMVGTLEYPGKYPTTTTRSVSPPPYSAPLPGIRIIVQTFDPDTGQVKEFRVAQDFKTH